MSFLPAVHARLDLDVAVRDIDRTVSALCDTASRDGVTVNVDAGALTPGSSTTVSVDVVGSVDQVADFMVATVDVVAGEPVGV